MYFNFFENLCIVCGRLKRVWQTFYFRLNKKFCIVRDMRGHKDFMTRHMFIYFSIAYVMLRAAIIKVYL